MINNSYSYVLLALSLAYSVVTFSKMITTSPLSVYNKPSSKINVTDFFFKNVHNTQHFTTL